jgi:hypothetical protein
MSQEETSNALSSIDFNARYTPDTSAQGVEGFFVEVIDVAGQEFLKVAPSAQAKQEAIGLVVGGSETLGDSDRLLTEIIPLEYVAAADMLATLQPHIRGQGQIQALTGEGRLSGIILLAKNDAAHQFLQNQFRDRVVKKIYLALVDGQPPTSRGRVEAAIGRDTSQRKRMAVTSEKKGRAAISEYRTLEHFPEHTLLEVRPRTGRTHQIRVHMAFLGCPIVGDKVYGRRKPTLPLKRHFLHAHRLSITLPGETAARTFEAPLPDELQRALKALRSRT